MRLKPYWILALSVLLPALFLGCAGEPFTNSFAPAVGDKRQAEMSTVVLTKTSVAGMNIDQGNTQSMTVTLEVTEVQADGNVMLQATIDDLKVDQTMPQIPGMDLGTAMADMQNAVKEALTQAKGEQFSLKVGPDGAIIPSPDLRDLAGRVKRKTNASGGSAMLVNAAIDQALGEETLKEGVGTIFEVYRNEQSKQADSWTKTKSVRAGLPITISSTYTLGALDDATYAVSEAMDLKASGAPSNMPGMPAGMNLQIDADLTGTGVATHAVDRKTSWLTSYRSDFSLTGKMKMGGIPGVGDMDMTITGTSTATVTPL